jgi:hypothetical protein
MTRGAARLVLVAGLCAARGAAAAPEVASDTSEGIAVAADRLFEDGRTLAKQGAAAEACKRFEQSYALKHTFGSAVNLGDCARRDGHMGRAWQLYGEAARAAEHDGAANLAQFARDRAAAIAPHLCAVVVAISGPNREGATVRIAGGEAAPANRAGSWIALVDPGDIEVRVDAQIDGGASGARSERTVRCAAPGTVASLEVRTDAVTDVPAPAVALIAPIAAPEPRAADVSLGIGFLPDQGVGASLAFGAAIDGWTWTRFAIDIHLAGAVFRTRSFMEQQMSVRHTGTIAFLGPSLRYAPAPSLWFEAGPGITAGVWRGAGRTDGALWPGLDVSAGYWLLDWLRISIDGFGFIDPSPHLGPLSVMVGTRLP